MELGGTHLEPEYQRAHNIRPGDVVKAIPENARDVLLRREKEAIQRWVGVGRVRLLLEIRARVVGASVRRVPSAGRRREEELEPVEVREELGFFVC